MNYPANFTPDAEAGGFVVTFPDIPEAITQGEDEAEAMEMAIEVLETAFDFYFEDERPIPAPSAATSGQRLVPVNDELAAKVTNHNASLAG